MAAYTSSLSYNIFELVSKKAEYLKFYKQMANDPGILSVAEEGMFDYFRQVDND